MQHLYADKLAIDHPDLPPLDFKIRAQKVEEHLSYLIGYQSNDLREMSFQQRVRWLCHFTINKKNKMTQNKMDNY